jgi:hypothetical protein
MARKSIPLAILLVTTLGSLRVLADSVTKIRAEDRLDYFYMEQERDLHNLLTWVDTPKADPTVRTYTHAAYCVMALGADPRIAEKLIGRAMAKQDMDPQSANFGNVPWEMSGHSISDANSVEFTFSPIGPILLGYPDKLSPDFKTDLLRHAAAAIPAMYRHKVPVTYTNIYLMKTENLILLGEAVNDEKAIATGRAQLDTWLDWTRSHGIHEYASPTYASVQMYCALDLYRQTHLADVRAKIKTALDYLWADAAASYFAPTAMMAGAHSRDYDFLRATGPIDRFYYMEGLRDATPASAIFVDSYGAYLNALEHGYEPSPEILALAREPERVVKETWDQTPGADRYTYITPDFAIGSTSAYYGAQDREVGVDFGDARPYIPVSVCVAADTFDSPYGKVRQLDRSGHEKPFRLRTNVATVQDHGAILALFNLSPDLPRTTAKSLGTDVLLPLHADRMILDGRDVRFPADALAAEKLALDKKEVESSSWDSWWLPVHLDSVVAFRYGHAAVAIRIFAADGVDKQTPLLALKCDGAEWGAGRLVAYHYRGEAKKIEQKIVRAGLLVLASHCNGDGDLAALATESRNAEIHHDMTGNNWGARAIVPTSTRVTLEAGLDVSTGAPVFRMVNGVSYCPERFTVNARDINAELFGSPGGR